MTTDENQTIGAQGFAVTVEMGDGFTPGPRTAAALAELVGALQQEHGSESEVEGYSFDTPPQIGGFAFVALGDGNTSGRLKWQPITLKRGITSEL